MRFYVVDANQHKLYITFPQPIETRSNIPDYFETNCQQCGLNRYFSRNDVHAEADTNSAAGGAVLGGLIGALGGPEGIIIGGIIGGLLGTNANSEDQRRIRRFEQSW